MPDAFISITTSWASGVGSANGISSSPRSPVKTTPRIASSRFSWGPILNGKTGLARGEPAELKMRSSFRGAQSANPESRDSGFASPTRPGMTPLKSNRAGRDIDHQRQQRGVEDERDDAVHGGGAADGLVGDADVGNLRGHADHEREIDEIPVVRVFMGVAARELQAAGLGAAV